MTDPDAIIHELRTVLEKEQGLANYLEKSLVKARESAESELNPDLFQALEWPIDIEQYEDYLTRLVRWVPRQTSAKAWQEQKAGQPHAEEVNDLTAHFYFLVNQDVDGSAPQGSEAFRGWMTEFARQWGSFLDTAESFSPESCSRSSTTRRSTASKSRWSTVCRTCPADG